jgi:dephospho-CoA kinase
MNAIAITQPSDAVPRGSKQQLRVSVIGHSGCGKSTFARLLRQTLEHRGATVEIIRLAEPLYRLQQQVYQAAATPIAPYDQDQKLLEALASHMRRIEPASLVNDFVTRLAATRATVVLNDDLRDPWVDYPTLREAGFKVIRVVACEQARLQRLAARADRSAVLRSDTTRELEMIPTDQTIVNDGSLAELALAVEKVVRSL